jgi:glycine dehydrogenase subunit 2
MCVHLNLHKTFATPAWRRRSWFRPYRCQKGAAAFLPGPRVTCQDGHYSWTNYSDKSIGKVQWLQRQLRHHRPRAYAYILSMGGTGLKQASMDAVLNANYHEGYPVQGLRFTL